MQRLLRLIAIWQPSTQASNVWILPEEVLHRSDRYFWIVVILSRPQVPDAFDCVQLEEQAMIVPELSSTPFLAAGDGFALEILHRALVPPVDPRRRIDFAI